MKIRELKVYPPVVLAPMVGLSHSALRSLVVELGGVGLLYTEMLSARRLAHENPDRSPLLLRGAKEKPLFYQLAAANVDHLPAAIDKLHRLQADGIDLNLGCSAPSQRIQGSGLALSKSRQELLPVLRLLRQRTALPFSVKIRLGESLAPGGLVDMCSFYEDQGVDCIAVHARLDQDKFCRKPRWSAVAAVKQAVNIPVVVNGGIFSVADARACLAESAADALMIGRGGVYRPWLFAEIAEQLYGLSTKNDALNKKDIYFRFVDCLEDRFPQDLQLVRLKLFSRYFAVSFAFGHQLASAIQNADDVDEAKGRAADFFDQCTARELSLL